MTAKYQSLFRDLDHLRDHPKLFARLVEELQHELEREARETLRVHSPAFERDTRIVWEDA
jgi:cytochrome P450